MALLAIDCDEHHPVSIFTVKEHCALDNTSLIEVGDFKVFVVSSNELLSELVKTVLEKCVTAPSHFVIEELERLMQGFQGNLLILYLKSWSNSGHRDEQGDFTSTAPGHWHRRWYPVLKKVGHNKEEHSLALDWHNKYLASYVESVDNKNRLLEVLLAGGLIEGYKFHEAPTRPLENFTLPSNKTPVDALRF